MSTAIPVLLTHHALAILQAALSADRHRLAEAASNSPRTAESLAPALARLNAEHQHAGTAAAEALHAMQTSMQILLDALACDTGIRRTQDQVAGVAAAVEELAASAAEISRNAAAAAEQADASSAQNERGNIAVSTLMGDIDLLEVTVRAMASGMARFVGFSQEINKLTSTVRDIAHQTNLLALNAAIEAARAGEAGRGFAVVAGEVKQLADKTAGATTEIERVTNTMNALTKEVSAEVESSQSRLGDSVDALEAVATSLAEAGSVVREVTHRVHEIAAAAQQQSTVSQDMAERLGSVSNALAHEGKQAQRVAAHARTACAHGSAQFKALAGTGREDMVLHAVKADYLMGQLSHSAESGAQRRPGDTHKSAKQPAASGADNVFAAWYTGAAKSRYGKHPAYPEIGRAHQSTQAAVTRLSQLRAAGDAKATDHQQEEVERCIQALFAQIDRLR